MDAVRFQGGIFLKKTKKQKATQTFFTFLKICRGVLIVSLNAPLTFQSSDSFNTMIPSLLREIYGLALLDVATVFFIN